MPRIARQIDYTLPQPVGTPRLEYPFEATGDLGTFVLRQDYKQAAAAYLADAQAGRYVPGTVVHVDHPDAYLIATSTPEVTATGLYLYTRTWATLPPTQYQPSSRLYSRPAMHDLKSGSTYAVSFDDGVTSHLFTARTSVSNVGSITEATTAVEKVSGTPQAPLPTFNVRVQGVFSSVWRTNYFTDSDNANVVRERIQNVVVAAAANIGVFSDVYTRGLSWDLGPNIIERVSGDIIIRPAGRGAEIIAGPGVPVPNAEEWQPDTPTRIRTITASGHGAAAGELIALWNGDKLVTTTKVVGISGSNLTLRADEGPLAVGNIAITHLARAAAGTRYVNGPIDVTARTVQRFYLPGVSPGITNMADIPTFTPITDPVQWLGAVVAYAAAPSEDTYALIETSSLERWLGGPILMKAVTEVQLQDAMVTVSASA